MLINIINMNTDDRFIDADEAIGRLGVRRATLYAYVSRGLVRSEPDAGDPRRSRYSADDVDRLAAGRKRSRSPGRAAAATLDWGLPVLDSAITLIERGRLYYRGVDAVELAGREGLEGHEGLEGTARLLWGCGEVDPFAAPAPVGIPPARAEGAGPDGLVARCTARLAAEGLAESETWARDPQRRWTGAASLLRRMAAAAIDRAPSAEPVAETLARHWRADAETVRRIRMALVLTADHELNASTFSTRVVASTGAALAAAVIAGMAALAGPRHGGMTLRVQALLDEVSGPGAIEAAIARRLRRGDGLPGFGHPLYPAGDPRAAALLAHLRLDPAMREVIAAAARLTGEAPNVDFALVALGRCHGLPAEAPFTLFLVGRTVGWIAHALEQQATGGLIRPRARYVGPPPAA